MISHNSKRYLVLEDQIATANLLKQNFRKSSTKGRLNTAKASEKLLALIELIKQINIYFFKHPM